MSLRSSESCYSGHGRDRSLFIQEMLDVEQYLITAPIYGQTARTFKNRVQLGELQICSMKGNKIPSHTRGVRNKQSTNQSRLMYKLAKMGKCIR
jgi:hypothetical protein